MSRDNELDSRKHLHQFGKHIILVDSVQVQVNFIHNNDASNFFGFGETLSN